MKRFNNIIKTAAILALATLASCVEMEEQGSAVGYLVTPALDVDVTVDDPVQTKALDFEIAAPEVAAVHFVVKDKDGVVKYNGDGLWPEPLVMPVGTYTVEASYGENGFDGPCFTGTASGIIDPLDNEVPQIVLTLGNALVNVTVHSEFAQHFTGEKVLANSGAIQADFGEWLYVPSGSDLTLTLSGKNSAGKDASFIHTLTSPAAKTAYSVVCTASATNWPSISLTVNSDEVWASRIYITTPASFSGNISTENKSSVVYEAIPSSSSDWTSPATAVSEDGVLVIKGLTTGTEYQVRARVGALVSNIVKVTPSLDGFSATAAHTFASGDLDGTDVTTVFAKSDAVKNSISSWTINLCKADGTVLRSGLSIGTSDGSVITSTNGWPYLPVGSYKIVGTVTMKDGEEVNVETAFSTNHPSFTVTPTCKTTYDYYLAGDKSNANAESGSKTAQAGAPNHSLYEIGSSVAISSNLMKNTNYSKTVYYAAKKDDAVVIDATVDFGMSKSNTVGDVHDLFTDWRAYTLLVEVNFAGSSVTATDAFHITGLPYSMAKNVQSDYWTLSGGTTSLDETTISLNHSTDNSAILNLYAASSIDVSVNVGRISIVTPTLFGKPKLTVKIGGTSVKELEGNSGTNKTTNFDNQTFTGTVTSSNPQVVFNRTYFAGREGPARISDVSVSYR